MSHRDDKENQAHRSTSRNGSRCHKQCDAFKRGHAPSELGNDYCKHAIARKAAAGPRRPRFIEVQGFLRIADSFCNANRWLIDLRLPAL